MVSDKSSDVLSRKMDNGTPQNDMASQRIESLTSPRWVLEISSHRVMGYSRPALCVSCLPG